MFWENFLLDEDDDYEPDDWWNHMSAASLATKTRKTRRKNSPKGIDVPFYEETRHNAF